MSVAGAFLFSLKVAGELAGAGGAAGVTAAPRGMSARLLLLVASVRRGSASCRTGGATPQVPCVREKKRQRHNAKAEP